MEASVRRALVALLTLAGTANEAELRIENATVVSAHAAFHGDFALLDSSPATLHIRRQNADRCAETRIDLQARTCSVAYTEVDGVKELF